MMVTFGKAMAVTTTAELRKASFVTVAPPSLLTSVTKNAEIVETSAIINVMMEILTH